MNHDIPAYGLWSLVIINSAIFILFAFSFFKPKTTRDWRTFGAFSAFIVALFVEMYGFPLTIYLLSGWLTRRFPGIDPLGHDFGHLWYTLLGFEGDPHFNPIHIASNLVIFGGFILLSGAWRVLFQAQREGQLATTGPYAYVRHPQYVAFVSIMFGFLLQWPTLVTLVMFPVMVTVYARLARREDLELIRQSFCSHVKVLPEAAGVVFGGGFPREDDPACRRAAQRAIFHVQRELEVTGDSHNPAIVLCDRGTVDGLAYWPGSPEEFWSSLGTALGSELGRYDAVIHLRTPALGQGYNHENPLRTESPAAAAEIDTRIARAWEPHPHRFIVESSSNFLDKAARALEILRAEMPECCKRHVIPAIRDRQREGK